MSYRQAGTGYSEFDYGLIAMGVRGNSPPAYEGGENSLAPLTMDADGRLRVADAPDDWDASYYLASTTNAAAAITLAAPAADRAWELAGVLLSYAGGTVTGKLTVAKGAGPTTVMEIDITATGPLLVPFPRPRRGGAGEQVVVTLGAGGTGVTGKLTLLGVRQVTAPGFPERTPGQLDFSDANNSGHI